jgi:prevent-host-death family protein
MGKLPPILPVTRMRTHHTDVLDLAKNEPVVLAQRSQPVVVVVSVKQWNRLMARLEEQQDIIDVLEAELEDARSGEQAEPVDVAELEAIAAGHAIPA